MPRLYKTDLWQLQLPDTWHVHDTCGHKIVTLFRPDGIGVLIVHTTEDQSPSQDGRDENFRGRLTGRTYESTYGNKFRRVWALLCRGQRLWVNYTCAAKNLELERLEVDEIVKSISEAD